MNEWRRQELSELGYLGALQVNVLGSLSEERRQSSTPKFQKELRRVNKLRKTHNFDLVRKNKAFNREVLLKPYKKETFQGYLLSCFPKNPIFPQLENRLSELTAEYPSYSQVTLEVQGFHRLEGKELAKKLVRILIYFNYHLQSEEDSYLRYIIAEKVIKMTRNYQGESNSGWDNVRLLLNFFSRPEITNEYLQLKYQNKSALWQMYKSGSELVSLLEISFFPGTSRIVEVIRKRGYSDHGSLKPNHEKGREEFSVEYLKDRYGEDLISEEEGGILLVKDYEDTKKTLTDQLLEIWKNSNEAFLEFQEQEKEKKMRQKTQNTKIPSETNNFKYHSKGGINYEQESDKH